VHEVVEQMTLIPTPGQAIPYVRCYLQVEQKDCAVCSQHGNTLHLSGRMLRAPFRAGCCELEFKFSARSDSKFKVFPFSS
jgi:hypothetical protein